MYLWPEKHDAKRIVRFVVNADDLGYATERDEGILEAASNGLVSSASVLANGQSANNALKKWAKMFECISPPYGLGLHLNLTEGPPISDPVKISSLLIEKEDEGEEHTNGRLTFRGKFGFEKAVGDGKIDMKDVETELRAQLEWFRKNIGCYPDHVDGHNHAHVLPGGVCEVVSRLCARFGIQWVRLPLEKDISRSSSAFLQRVVQNAKRAKKIFHSFGVQTSDFFFGLELMGKNMTEAGLEKVFRSVATIVNHDKTNKKIEGNIFSNDDNSSSRVFTAELMCHPGYPSRSGDGFSKSNERLHELKCLTSKKLLQQVAAMKKVKLCTYRRPAMSLSLQHISNTAVNDDSDGKALVLGSVEKQLAGVRMK
eukprot:jgi/Bigna1/127657/aug1.5_g2365